MDNKGAGPFLVALLGAIAACSSQPTVRVRGRTARLPVLDMKHSPPTWKYYPNIPYLIDRPVIAGVWVCIGPDGHASGTPSIRKSSGIMAMDKAALRWMSDARFLPGSVDGKPTVICTEIDVHFMPKG